MCFACRLAVTTGIMHGNKGARVSIAAFRTGSIRWSWPLRWAAALARQQGCSLRIPDVGATGGKRAQKV